MFVRGRMKADARTWWVGDDDEVIESSNGMQRGMESL
jgi:hypothetical protein